MKRKDVREATDAVGHGTPRQFQKPDCASIDRLLAKQGEKVFENPEPQGVVRYVLGQMAWTLVSESLPSIPEKTSRTFLVVARSRYGKLYCATARFAHNFWLEWSDGFHPDEKEIDDEGGKVWNGWMEDRLAMGGDDVSCGFDGEVIAWSPMPTPSVVLEPKSANASGSPKQPVLAKQAPPSEDTKRLDWLENNVHWNDPTSRAKVVFRFDTAPIITLREAIDKALQDAIEASAGMQHGAPREFPKEEESVAPPSAITKEGIPMYFELAWLLGEIGWVASGDAQWEHLRDQIPQIQRLLSATTKDKSLEEAFQLIHDISDSGYLQPKHTSDDPLYARLEQWCDHHRPPTYGGLLKTEALATNTPHEGQEKTDLGNPEPK